MTKNPMVSLISQRYIKTRYVLVENMSCCVYFISDGEFVKIGVAESLPNRIKELQTGNPRKLFALYVIDTNSKIDALKIERDLHKLFSSVRCIGEWFEINDEEIKRGCRKLGYIPKVPASKFDFETDGILLVKIRETENDLQFQNT